MNRSECLAQALNRTRPFDIAIIGGGATGAGIALDAASRGFEVLLIDQGDFGIGTSSRSTKLIHGGVRYLAQGRLGLIRQALHERAVLQRNAPHLVHAKPFIIPAHNWYEIAKFTAGLKLYDLLAGSGAFDRSKVLNAAGVREHLPTLGGVSLAGGILYYDGQFDDARLLIALLQTAVDHGALVANYCKLTELHKNGIGRIEGLSFTDLETAAVHRVNAHLVINATGVWTDQVQNLDEAGGLPAVTLSQGAHIVVDKAFLRSEAALLMPHTPDGRIMFAIPWQGHVLLGTTDTPLTALPMEPRALPAEIEQILAVAAAYLDPAPSRNDIRAVFAGIRPLIRARPGTPTAAVSREHRIEVSRSGLVSITGGKWTTYRHMAEDCIDIALRAHGIPHRHCRTETLALHGADTLANTDALAIYGTDAAGIRALISSNASLGERVDPALPDTAAECLWAVRHEMARTVDDVLSRRRRIAFTDLGAACRSAPRVAALMAAELSRDAVWQEHQVAALKQRLENLEAAFQI